MNRKGNTFAVYILCLLLAGCASWFQTTPTKVDSVDQRYIEAETSLKNAYGTLSRLADKELAARAAGSPPGTVISKERYIATLDKLDAARNILRTGRAMVPTACLDASVYRELGLSGCLNKNQIALAVLAILTRVNE